MEGAVARFGNMGRPEDGRTLASILSDVLVLTDADLAMLCRVDLGAGRVERVAIVGLDSPPAMIDSTPLGVGLVGQCAMTGEVVHCADVRDDPRVVFPALQRELGIRSVLHVPLSLDGVVIGVLCAESREVGHFSEEHVAHLSAFAHAVAATIAKIWTLRGTAATDASGNPAERYRQRLERVRSLSALVHGLSDLDAVFVHALEAAAELTWAARVLISLVDPDRRVIRGRCGRGLPPEVVAETVRPLHDAASFDEDILAYVVRTGQPSFTQVDDFRLDRETARRHGLLKYGLVVPIVGRSGVLGTLSASWNHDALADSATLDLALLLADHLAGAIETHRLLEVERRQRQIAERLHEVAQQVAAGLRLEQALGAVLQAVEALFGAASASIYLSDQSGLRPERRYTTRFTGIPHWQDKQIANFAPNGPTMTVLQTGQPVVIADVQTDPRTRDYVEEDTQTMASVPVRYGERVVGVLHTNWCEIRTCTPDDLALLETLAAYGAVAIETERLYARAVQAARLDGVLLTSRTLAHELNNDLAVALGMAELALDRERAGHPIGSAELELIVQGARRVARHVQQFQRIVRLEERHFDNLPPILDLDRSSAQP